MRDAGVPLAHYLASYPLYGVRFHCCACQWSRDVDLRQVLDRLRRRGLGDERTGIRALAGICGPCPRCGAAAWETRPAWRPILADEKGPARAGPVVREETAAKPPAARDL